MTNLSMEEAKAILEEHDVSRRDALKAGALAVAGSAAMSGSAAAQSGDEPLIELAEGSTDPSANGEITRNGADIKAYSGGSVKSLSDIGTGGGGGDSWSVSSITDADSPYDASDNEFIIADASSAAITINVPTPGSDVQFGVFVTNASNNVTLSRSGTESINGEATDFVVENAPSGFGFISDGTDWVTHHVSGRQTARQGMVIPWDSTQSDREIRFSGSENIAIYKKLNSGGEDTLVIDGRGEVEIDVTPGFAGGPELISQEGVFDITLSGSGSNTDFAFRDNRLAFGGTKDLANPRAIRYTVQDVRNITSPAQGWVAYHDGSGTNTEGLAAYNGTSWISQVDGSTVS